MSGTDRGTYPAQRALGRRNAMKLSEVFSSPNVSATLTAFDADALGAIEASLSSRNGKLYIRCRVRETDVIARPEEVVRQLWLYRLETHYGYLRSRIAVEYPITFGRDSSKRADIVVFDADRPTVPYVIVEVKQGLVRSGKDQLKSYTHATGAPIALWSNGASSVVWHPQRPRQLPSPRPRSGRHRARQLAARRMREATGRGAGEAPRPAPRRRRRRRPG